MSVVLAVVVGALAVSVAVLGWERWRPAGVIQARVRRRVIVTLKSGQAFTGMLVEADRWALALREVTVVDARGDPIPVDGEVVCLAGEVDYVQML